MKEKRLQKILAEAGLCSRREAEKWIEAGRVSLNGKRVTQLGTKANPISDKIAVDGKRVKFVTKKVYYLFHKPKNVMVTHFDPEDRPTIYDYLGNIKERVYPVGRLDFDSEGLILLTNDGDLTFELTHPKSKVPKTYEVKISGIPTPEILEKLEKGVRLDWGTTQPTKVKILKKTDKNCWLQISLTEGKNRQVRKMIEKFNFFVIRLRRTAIGLFKLGALKPGHYAKINY
ncbi:MAG: rRNA pseudouridine synthase [Deltaproteobacteria bacterium]|nr:rRNA pseudouridine synthase [Deltaproteobacteria bacterium]